MEKFGTWCDQATGIRPFIPQFKPLSKLWVVFRYIFGVLKFIISIPILFSFYVNPTICALFPIPIVARLLVRINHICQSILLLLLNGVYWVKVVPTPLIKKIVLDETWEKPSHGDLVFAPLASYLNLIWLNLKLSPTFAIPVSKDEVVVRSFHALVYKILTNQELRNGKSEKLVDVLSRNKKKMRGPVVIFAEGAPTNGTGVLKFMPIQCDLPEGTKVSAIGFVHEYTGVSPNYVCGSSINYILNMYGRLHGSMKVVVALKKDLPSHDGKLTPEFNENIRDILAKIMRVQTLALGADQYREYINEYNGKIMEHKTKSE